MTNAFGAASRVLIVFAFAAAYLPLVLLEFILNQRSSRSGELDSGRSEAIAQPEERPEVAVPG